MDAKDKAAALEQRIEQLESWIEQVITRPAMPRELRLQGLQLVESKWMEEVQDKSADIRKAVERICPEQGRELGHTLEIER